MVQDYEGRPKNSSRRSFLKIGAGVLAGAAVASVVDIPLAGAKPTEASTASLKAELDSTRSQLTTLQDRLSASEKKAVTLQATSTSLQTELDTLMGFLYLNETERPLLEAVAESIIPTDSNGAGAKEAGVIYFIDRQLASDYGKNGTMYMEGPFFLPNQTDPIIVDGIYYPHGTPQFGIYSGAGYQYSMDMRFFWRWGLDALEAYANSAYGGNFETLTGAQQTQVLQDLWNNKPTSFNDIVPQDFAYELFLLVWAGFLSDPMYGGNQNMVGWTLTGFTGVNQGDFYGEGHTQKELMVATTPTRLQPASLAQFQKGSP